MSLSLMPPPMPAVRTVGRPRVADDPAERSKHLRCAVRRICDRKPVAAVAKEMDVSERTVRNWTRLALSYIDAPEVPHLRRMARR